MQFARKMTLAAGVSAAAWIGLAFVNPTPAMADGGRQGTRTTQGTRIQTKLTGGPISGVTPNGSARFRTRGTSSSFEVEVEDVNLPNGTVLTVTLTSGGVSAPAGTMTLNAREAEIEVSTTASQVVPQAKAGDVVIVSDAAGNALLSGVLH